MTVIGPDRYSITLWMGRSRSVRHWLCIVRLLNRRDFERPETFFSIERQVAGCCLLRRGFLLRDPVLGIRTDSECHPGKAKGKGHCNDLFVVAPKAQGIHYGPLPAPATKSDGVWEATLAALRLGISAFPWP